MKPVQSHVFLNVHPFSSAYPWPGLWGSSLNRDPRHFGENTDVFKGQSIPVVPPACSSPTSFSNGFRKSFIVILLDKNNCLHQRSPSDASLGPCTSLGPSRWCGSRRMCPHPGWAPLGSPGGGSCCWGPLPRSTWRS